eukprot:6214768-Pleurochrysis_carterae.AAC.3
MLTPRTAEQHHAVAGRGGNKLRPGHVRTGGLASKAASKDGSKTGSSTNARHQSAAALQNDMSCFSQRFRSPVNIDCRSVSNFEEPSSNPKQRWC